MNPTFPVFLKDRDGWMYYVGAKEDLDTQLEHIDVEDREYSGWDALGWPVEVVIQDREISCRVSRVDGPDVAAVKAAIANYAEIAGPKNEPFLPPKNTDLHTLFTEADAHAKKSGLARRIGSLFNRR